MYSRTEVAILAPLLLYVFYIPFGSTCCVHLFFTMSSFSPQSFAFDIIWCWCLFEDSIRDSFFFWSAFFVLRYFQFAFKFFAECLYIFIMLHFSLGEKEKDRTFRAGLMIFSVALFCVFDCYHNSLRWLPYIKVRFCFVLTIIRCIFPIRKY